MRGGDQFLGVAAGERLLEACGERNLSVAQRATLGRGRAGPALELSGPRSASMSENVRHSWTPFVWQTVPMFECRRCEAAHEHRRRECGERWQDSRRAWRVCQMPSGLALGRLRERNTALVHPGGS